MADISTQKQLYHLTDLANLESILQNGILPRSRLNGFVDVADPAIVASRRSLQLENYVPFHFFAKNPFDGRVQLSHPMKEFVLLTVTRQLAQNEGWKVIPKHPLASGVPQLLDYEDGMEQIDWDLMNLRDYQDEQSRLTCMAECLSPSEVKAGSIFSIIVKSEETAEYVRELLATNSINCHVNVHPNMFI